jgi:hypothetical protein
MCYNKDENRRSCVELLDLLPYNPEQVLIYNTGTPARDQYSVWVLGKSLFIS